MSQPAKCRLDRLWLELWGHQREKLNYKEIKHERQWPCVDFFPLLTVKLTLSVDNTRISQECIYCTGVPLATTGHVLSPYIILVVPDNQFVRHWHMDWTDTQQWRVGIIFTMALLTSSYDSELESPLSFAGENAELTSGSPWESFLALPINFLNFNPAHGTTKYIRLQYR